MLLWPFHQASAQSPWTRGKASFYAQGAWQFIPSYTSIFDKSSETGKRSLERAISENTFQLYGEYGISRKTTVLTSIPFRFLHSGDIVDHAPTGLNAGSIGGFGNISLALRHNFHSEKLAFSGQIKIDLPNNKKKESTGLRTGFDAFTFLPTLSIGQGYGRAYWFAYAGWGVQGKWTNHFVNTGAEAGLKVKKNWFILFSDFRWNTGSKAYPVGGNYIKTALFLPTQSYWAFGGKGIFAFHRFWGGVVTAAGAFDGDLVPSQPAFALGVYFKWD